MKRYLKLLALLTSLLLLLASCSAVDKLFDDDEIRGHTLVMLEGIVQNDIDKSYSTVSDVCTKHQFEPTFEQMRAMLNGVKSYSISLIGFNTNVDYSTKGEVKTVTADYSLETDKSDFIVSAEMQTGYAALKSFYITPVEHTDLYYTGTIDSMQNANIAQWVILLLNLAVVAVTVIAIIDCARRKIKKKALWIVIIVLGMLLFGWTATETSFHINFNLGLFTYSAYIIYGSGKTVMRILIPLGAIVYFALRKSLERKATEQPIASPYAQMQDTPPAEAPQQNQASVYCTKCGNKNAANALYCTKCGEKLNNV